MTMCDVVLKVEAQWRARAKAQHYKFGTPKYAKAEIEFFTGAMAALHAAGNASWSYPIWVVNAMSGRPIVDKDGPVASPDESTVVVPSDGSEPTPRKP